MKFATFVTTLNSEFDERISHYRFYLINLIFTQQIIFEKLFELSLFEINYNEFFIEIRKIQKKLYIFDVA